MRELTFRSRLTVEIIFFDGRNGGRPAERQPRQRIRNERRPTLGQVTFHADVDENQLAAIPSLCLALLYVSTVSANSEQKNDCTCAWRRRQVLLQANGSAVGRRADRSRFTRTKTLPRVLTYLDFFERYDRYVPCSELVIGEDRRRRRCGQTYSECIARRR